MRVIQIILCAAAVMLLTSSVMAGPVLRGDPQVIVELVPDNPGPYFGGELLIPSYEPPCAAACKSVAGWKVKALGGV